MCSTVAGLSDRALYVCRDAEGQRKQGTFMCTLGGRGFWGGGGGGGMAGHAGRSSQECMDVMCSAVIGHAGRGLTAHGRMKAVNEVVNALNSEFMVPYCRQAMRLVH